MKLFQSAVQPEKFAAAEFRTRMPDNLLRVESTREGGVIICAARNNFDPACRRTFVRYLKAEGFIPKGQRLAGGDGEADAIPTDNQVRWVCDPCWPYAAVRFNPYTRRLCAHLLLWPTLAWLLLMWIGASC